MSGNSLAGSLSVSPSTCLRPLQSVSPRPRPVAQRLVPTMEDTPDPDLQARCLSHASCRTVLPVCRPYALCASFSSIFCKEQLLILLAGGLAPLASRCENEGEFQKSIPAGFWREEEPPGTGAPCFVPAVHPWLPRPLVASMGLARSTPYSGCCCFSPLGILLGVGVCFVLLSHPFVSLSICGHSSTQST